MLHLQDGSPVVAFLRFEGDALGAQHDVAHGARERTGVIGLHQAGERTELDENLGFQRQGVHGESLALVVGEVEGQVENDVLRDGGSVVSLRGTL